LLAGIAAFVLLEWVPIGTKRDPKAQGGEDELAVWQLLVTGEVVVWALLAAFGLRTLKKLDCAPPKPAAGEHSREAAPVSPDADTVPLSCRRRLSPRRWRRSLLLTSRSPWWREKAKFVAFTYGTVVLLFVIGGVAGLTNPTVLQGQVWKNVVLHLVALVAVTPFLVVLKTIQLCADEDAFWSKTERDIQLVQALRRRLQSATLCLGAIIALAVISTGALRNAVDAAKLAALPETFVVLYGAWFTAILAGIYLYVFGALEQRGRRIVEHAAAPRGKADLASMEERDAGGRLRKSLSEELEMGGDPRKNLEGLVAVLSPLIGALLSQLGGL
jgi:hypothetical protein